MIELRQRPPSRSAGDGQPDTRAEPTGGARYNQWLGDPSCPPSEIVGRRSLVDHISFAEVGRHATPSAQPEQSRGHRERR